MPELLYIGPDGQPRSLSREGLDTEKIAGIAQRDAAIYQRKQELDITYREAKAKQAASEAKLAEAATQDEAAKQAYMALTEQRANMSEEELSYDNFQRTVAPIKDPSIVRDLTTKFLQTQEEKKYAKGVEKATKRIEKDVIEQVYDEAEGERLMEELQATASSGGNLASIYDELDERRKEKNARVQKEKAWAETLPQMRAMVDLIPEGSVRDQVDMIVTNLENPDHTETRFEKDPVAEMDRLQRMAMGEDFFPQQPEPERPSYAKDFVRLAQEKLVAEGADPKDTKKKQGKQGKQEKLASVLQGQKVGDKPPTYQELRAIVEL